MVKIKNQKSKIAPRLGEAGKNKDLKLKIFDLNEIKDIIVPLKQPDKRVVLVGGCFDVLHPGHIRFLEEAKKSGDILVVALESDEKVRLLKGKNRPVFNQEERAEMLAALSMIDIIILLPMMIGGQPYTEMINNIKPDVIAVTEDDPLLKKKKMEVEKCGGKLAVVIPRIKKYATINLLKILDHI